MPRSWITVALVLAPFALAGCVNVEKSPPPQVVVQPTPSQPAPSTTVVVPPPPQ
jgi:hypothetical protein